MSPHPLLWLLGSFLGCSSDPEPPAPLELEQRSPSDGIPGDIFGKTLKGFEFAVANLEGRDVSDLPVRVSLSEEIEETSGYLILVGFVSHNPNTLLPSLDSQPVDMERVGVVKEWPKEAVVGLIDGLYYSAILSQDAMPHPDDFLSTAVQVDASSKDVVEFTIDRTIDPLRMSKVADRTAFEATLEIDLVPRPKAAEYGNVFLLGFAEIDPDSQSPLNGSVPIDFKQIGVAVQDWPIQRNTTVYEGVHYFAFHSMGTSPGEGDRISAVTTLTSAPDEVVKVVIGDIPGSKSRQRTDGLTANRTELRLDAAPRPKETGQKLYLLGYPAESISGPSIPDRATPWDKRVIEEDVQAWPLKIETDLYESLVYYALLTSGTSISQGNLHSTPFQSNSAQLSKNVLMDRQLGTTPQMGRSVADVGEPATLVINSTLSPSRKDRLFLVGFSSLDEEGSPPKDDRPSDHELLAKSIDPWPLEVQATLDENLYYFVFMSSAEQPGPGDPTTMGFQKEGRDKIEMSLIKSAARTPRDNRAKLRNIGSPVTLTVDYSKQAGNSAGKSLILVGFDPLPDSLKGPQETLPKDHEVLSENVESWPIEVTGTMDEGLDYFVFLSDSEEPEPGDLTTHAFQKQGREQITLTLSDTPGATRDKSGKRSGSPRDKSGKRSGSPVANIGEPVTLFLDSIDAPAPESPTKLMLMGFRELDSEHRPIAGARPDDWEELASDLTAWPSLLEATLDESLIYLLVMGKDDKQQPVSAPFRANGQTFAEVRLLVRKELRLAPTGEKGKPYSLKKETPDGAEVIPTPNASVLEPAVDEASPPPPLQKGDSKIMEAFLLALIAGLVAGWFVPLIRRKR